jgi:tripartite-type tricarboxylate transporter receptor subunit TctC
MDRRTAVLSVSAAALWPWASATWAQAGATAAEAYPRPGQAVRYVVPFPPGGLTDVMARLVAQQLAERWKAQVVVDNKPGSGGQIGAAEVAKAAPDGHTLLAITMSHAVNATLFKGRAPFDFGRDLRPVALLAGSPMLVVVPANSPITNLRDLQVVARARPLNAGSSGNGTPPHLVLSLFNEISRTQIQHVPYKGGAPSMVDLIGGQIDVIFSNFPESVAHVKAGKLRALAIASQARHPLLPDVPTTAEAGLAAMQVENWTGLMVPAATPDNVVNRLASEVLRIMASADVDERARTQGFRVDARGPQEAAAFVSSEVERWARVIAAAKISAE